MKCIVMYLFLRLIHETSFNAKSAQTNWILKILILTVSIMALVYSILLVSGSFCIIAAARITAWPNGQLRKPENQAIQKRARNSTELDWIEVKWEEHQEHSSGTVYLWRELQSLLIVKPLILMRSNIRVNGWCFLYL